MSNKRRGKLPGSLLQDSGKATREVQEREAGETGQAGAGVVDDSPKVGRPVDPGSLTSQLKTGNAKQLKAIVDAELHKRLKIPSVQEGRSISEIVEEAILEWLERNA